LEVFRRRTDVSGQAAEETENKKFNERKDINLFGKQKYLPYVQPNFTTGVFQEAEKIK
jgi:hypothetical protein